MPSHENLSILISSFKCDVYGVLRRPPNGVWVTPSTIALVGAEFQHTETGVQDGSSTLVVAMQESTGWSTKRWWNRTLVQWQSTAEHQMVVRTRTWTTDSLRQRSPPASAASLPLRAGPLYLFSFIPRFEESFKFIFLNYFLCMILARLK